MSWTCNLCESNNNSAWASLEREGSSCSGCGSSVRQRQLFDAIESVFAKASKHKMSILGLSDAPTIQKRLSFEKKFDYLNTEFDSQPRLDITKPSIVFYKSADIVLSSDVLEHVFFPPVKALIGTLKLLKPGGTLILTVPYSQQTSTVEHFPWMRGYRVEKQLTGEYVVIGSDENQKERHVENPVFHGGPGNTLEMRLFSKQDLEQQLLNSGFIDIKFSEGDQPEKGIRFQLSVITARRPEPRPNFNFRAHSRTRK